MKSIFLHLLIAVIAVSAAAMAYADTHCSYSVQGNIISDCNNRIVYDDKTRSSVFAALFAPYSDGKEAKWAKRDKNGVNEIGSIADGIVQLTYTYKVSKNQSVVAKCYYSLEEGKPLHVFYSSSAATYTLADYVDGRAIVKVDNTADSSRYSIVLNEQGDSLGRFPYDGVYPPSYDYMAVKSMRGMWGLMDKNMNIVIPCRYKDIHTSLSANGSIIGAQLQNKKWIVLNPHGEQLVDTVFDNVLLYKNFDYYFGQVNGQYAVFADSMQITKYQIDSIVGLLPECFVFKIKGKYALYNIPFRKKSSSYDEFRRGIYYPADSVMHGGAIFCFKKVEPGKEAMFCFVNGLGQVVVPPVISDEKQAFRALNYYKNLPVMNFNAVQLKRLRLLTSRRERIYHLDTLIPERDWDY